MMSIITCMNRSATKLKTIADLADAQLAKPFDTAVPLRARCRVRSRLPPYPLSVTACVDSASIVAEAVSAQPPIGLHDTRAEANRFRQ